MFFISYDPAKRERTLQERGLDFARAGEVFAGHHYSAEDLRKEYDEQRWITVGTLDGRMVVMVWTPRGQSERRIISMRKANEREKDSYGIFLDRS
jgi:uncharacterized DUF497 family protein